MPVLPDKFSLRGTAVPDGRRDIAKISYDSPLYAAGEKFGNAITGLGQKLRTPEKKEQDKPSEGASALSRAQTTIDTALKDIDAAPDPGQGGINGADYLQQAKDKILTSLTPEGQKQYGPSIEAMIESGMARVGERVQGKRNEARVAEVTALFAPLSAQTAALSDPTARQEINGAAFGSIDKLLADGTIDEKRALELKREFQLNLIEADVKAQPAAWQIEMLQKREGGDDKQSYFRRELGAEKSDLMLAQAQWQDKADKRDGGTQSLLDRFGTAPENESKALAEIDTQHGGDPTLKRFYLGRLQMQRRQERRDVAQSARNVYALALEGRQSDIEAADLQRLHAGGDLDDVLEAAQYARSAQAPGDLLFRERYEAMGEEERARFKPAELAQRLAPQDFLELMQGASGEIDEGQRSRMQGFVQAVTPMLRSVTVGDRARPEQVEKDRRLLALIHDEANVLVADEEKKIGRPLTATEYQSVMRRAADLALLHGVGLEGGDSDSAIPGALAWTAGLNDGSGMPPATSAGYNVAALDETDASSDSEPQAYLTNATQTDDPDSEEGDGDGEPGTLLAQRGSGSRRTGPGGRPLSTEEILRLESFNRATQRITAHKRDYTELRPNDFVPTPRQLERQELQANAVEFFAARNIELSTHAMFRFGERDNRGVTLPDALRAYNTGRLYYDVKYRTYIRYDVQTGVWVSTSAPRGGQILTVAQGNNPSSRWQPVPYR